MSLREGLLGLLDYMDMTGYDLMKAFDDSLSFFWKAQASQIYRELNHMEGQGLLSSRIEIQTDKPNKRIYSITEAGRERLREWLDSELPDQMLPVRSEALLRIFFSAGRPVEKNMESFRHIVEIYQARAKELDAISDVVEGYKDAAHSEEDLIYWDMTADFGRRFGEMCQDWAKACMRRLEEAR